MSKAELRLKGAPNFRDLGGYETKDGRHVRRGRVFRSEGLNQLSTEDYAALHDLGIKLICDLRSDYERSSKPTMWPQHLMPKTLVMDVNADLRAGKSDLWEMLRADPTERGVLGMMMHVYKFVPDALGKHLGKFFKAVADEEQLPLILHCSAGKDRTGVMSAVLLMTLGVPRETAVADYMKTHEYRDAVKLKKKVVELMLPILGTAPPDDVVEIMAGVHPDYLNASFDAIDGGHGSIDRYLESAGVTPAQIAKFTSLMLE
jgi:protein-tyrosine phosphatase